MTSPESPAVPTANRTEHVFDHVGISVAELESASAWYRRALDLTEASVFSVPGTDLRGTMLLHRTGFRIELVQRPGSVPGLQASGPDEAALTRGFGHLCLRVDDVDAAHAELVAAGAASRVEPRAAPRKGARMAWVADPEGNLIELIDRRS